MTAQVLLIDDARETFQLLRLRLRSEPLELHYADKPLEGLDKLRSLRPDLILLDMDMPSMDGVELCRIIKDDPNLALTPVIFLTGDDRLQSRVQALDAGAVDYIHKASDPLELRARVRAALRTKGYLDKLSERAHIDALTGLWNRRYCDRRMLEELDAWHRYKTSISLLMMDIDHFKHINDTYGHPFGDQVLKAVAGALTQRLRKRDVPCRYGGEEFAILLPNTGQRAARLVASALHDSISRLGLLFEGQPVDVTVSMGVACSELFDWEARSCTPEQLMALADGALYAAKRGGRNRTCEASPQNIEGLGEIH
jgi:diguanylate cyclase (GGDEF)-like protein